MEIIGLFKVNSYGYFNFYCVGIFFYRSIVEVCEVDYFVLDVERYVVIRCSIFFWGKFKGLEFSYLI